MLQKCIESEGRAIEKSVELLFPDMGVRVDAAVVAVIVVVAAVIVVYVMVIVKLVDFILSFSFPKKLIL